MKIEKVYREDLKTWRWKIDLTINGKRIRRADFETKQEAKDAIASLITSARAERYGLVKPQPKTALKHLDNKERIFTEFVKLIGPDAALVSLSKSDWRKYVEALQARDCKPGTINRYMAEVSGVLSSAHEKFPDLEDWKPPKAPWLEYPAGRNRILARKEIARLCMAFRSERQKSEQYFSVQNRAEVFDLFRLMLLTGAREGELLTLKQGQISWDWKTIRIESRKGNKAKPMLRVVPLSNLALEILKSRNGFSINKDRLYRTLRRVAEISGVIYGDNIENGWVLHDLRHVAATVMENAGIPYSAVSAILGHKRTDQTATYAHAQLDTLRKAVETLESWCRGIDGFVESSDQSKPRQATIRKASSQ